jgi:hypothetical protein
MDEARELFPQFAHNYGTAGVEYIRYVVKNQDAVRKTLNTYHEKIVQDLNTDHAERYWAALHACVLTALTVCRKLDLVRFDAKTLYQWIKTAVDLSRDQRKLSASDPVETFGRMLGDLSSGILRTIGIGDARNAAAEPKPPLPSAPIVGRCIFPAVKNDKITLLLSEEAIRRWCVKHGVSSQDIFAEGVKDGWIRPKPIRFSLGKGVPEYSDQSAQVKVWVIDADRLQSVFDTVLNIGTVSLAADNARELDDQKNETQA